MVDNEVELLLDLEEETLVEHPDDGGGVVEVVEAQVVEFEEGVDVGHLDVADVGLLGELHPIAIQDHVGLVLDVTDFEHVAHSVA